MRETTARQLIDAGFGPALGHDQADEVHRCGHQVGPHILSAAFGSPLDGGLYYCQEWPECPCTGTWSVDCPEDVKARYRHL